MAGGFWPVEISRLDQHSQARRVLTISQKPEREWVMLLQIWCVYVDHHGLLTTPENPCPNGIPQGPSSIPPDCSTKLTSDGQAAGCLGPYRHARASARGRNGQDSLMLCVILHLHACAWHLSPAPRVFFSLKELLHQSELWPGVLLVLALL